MSKVRCNNCMNVFYESDIVYDENENEHCPFCDKDGCLMDLECEIDKENKFIKIVNEIHEAIKKGVLKEDPNNKDNILVYRLAGNVDPEGWYSENILNVASELINDENNYKSFKEVIYMKKPSTKLSELLDEKSWCYLPNYDFELSLDDEIAEAYWHEDEKRIKRIEEYSSWCLDNLDLLEKINNVDE